MTSALIGGTNGVDAAEDVADQASRSTQGLFKSVDDTAAGAHAPGDTLTNTRKAAKLS